LELPAKAHATLWIIIIVGDENVMWVTYCLLVTHYVWMESFTRDYGCTSGMQLWTHGTNMPTIGQYVEDSFQPSSSMSLSFHTFPLAKLSPSHWVAYKLWDWHVL